MRAAHETEADRRLVRDLAGRVGALSVDGRASVDIRGGEDEAREQRYRWLAGVCVERGARWCVTGHSRDDQAETVLLRLARGTGTGGAGGMRVSAPWPLAWDSGRAPAQVLRPLLEHSRAEIEEYVASWAIEARHDASNDELGIQRNRVRHRVLPELQMVNARASEHLATFAERAAADSEALDAWAAQVLADHGSVEPGRVVVERAVLRGLPAAVAGRVLRLASSRLGVAIGEAQTSQALRGLHRGGARTRLAGAEVVVNGRRVIIHADGFEEVPE
jgi:tRNA(Ile)-lysidine synthetase-like protein